MRFGRNITILTLLVLVLAGVLIGNRCINPTRRILAGDRIFPMLADSITSIQWDVQDEDGKPLTVQLARQGTFWKMEAPYNGMLCDRAAINALLDQIQNLKVAAVVDTPAAQHFVDARTLVVATPEKRISCAFGEKPTMELTQQLAHCDNRVIAVKTADIDDFPTSAHQLFGREILPLPAERITAIEWRSSGKPFVSAQKKNDAIWTVTQPFAFEPNPDEVARVLKLLTNPQTITAYIRPAPSENSLAMLSETMLAPYGLDEEYAIRVVIRLKGFSEPLQLRFGKPDSMRPNHVYCLLNDRQSVVSVSEKIQHIFTEEGPFVASHEDLPLLGDVSNPTSIKIIGRSADEVTQLTKKQSIWEIATPTILPADPIATETLLQSILALTGDLTESQELMDSARICTVELGRPKDNKMAQLVFYRGKTAGELFAFRPESGRLYVLPEAALPTALFAEAGARNRTLLDRTILAIPAENIRRITVHFADELVETVGRAPKEETWQTEFPQGAYVKSLLIKDWTALFADLKAVAVLESAASFLEMKRYGLTHPAMKITLDLNEEANALRRILLIGQEKNGKVPVMIQGRPLIYELAPETVRLLQTSLTTSEEE